MTDQAPATPAPGHPSFREALAWWLKLGCISFGGPAGQIAIMHRELVERRRWISEGRFLHALNYCMVLPGPEAQQLATYIGYLLHGTRGGIAAGVLFVLPSLLLLAGLSWLYLAFHDLPALHAALWAVKPAVVAIVLHAAWRIGSRTLKHPLLWTIALSAFAGIALLDLPFPLVIALAALAGWLGNRRLPQAFAGGGHGGRAGGTHAPALLDDDTPPPAFLRYSTARLVRTAALFLALWAGVLAVLWLLEPRVLGAMALFFTQAALLTFGGAYAVLPYVTDAAVNHYHWATLPQMLDGLALGESTPGPLIMIVAFVGFVGGWTQGALGDPLGGALAGAAVATFFTFLPSFLFILAGAPLVEATREDLRIGAPLTAITAAVSGVIVSLALFFAGHVFFPAGSPDAGALLVAVLAFIALWKFDQSVLRVIGAAVLTGLVAG